MKNKTGLLLGVFICMFLLPGCVATTRQLEEMEGRITRQIQMVDRKAENISERQRQLEDARITPADLNRMKEELLERIYAVNRQIDRIEREKFSREDIRGLGLDEIRQRLFTSEYQIKALSEEWSRGYTTGYRNAMRAVRECVMEIAPTVRSKASEGQDYSIFVRDFRNINDEISVLGDLLSREFSAFTKVSTGITQAIYREEYVISLYQRKELQVPVAEAFHLENLEEAGFPGDVVIVISGKLTPTAGGFRLDVEANDLKDPRLRKTASRLIPRDDDIVEMYNSILDAKY